MHVFKSEKMMLEAAREMQLTQSCFVINDYCTQWPLFKKGSFTSIVEHFSEDKILIEEGINKSGTVEITVGDYIDRIKTGTKGMGNWSWQPHLNHADALEQSYSIPESITLRAIENSLVGELVLAPWMLMSAPETVTSMHKDMLCVNGVVGQLEGIKEFTLVSPDYSLQEGRYYTHAELAELNIPFESVMLHPGDFLYFPMHWWHQAKTIECSVTFIHSTVNSFNLTAFLNESIALMPAYIQRVQSAAKKRSYFGNKINWLCNGFRALG